MIASGLPRDVELRLVNRLADLFEQDGHVEHLHEALLLSGHFTEPQSLLLTATVAKLLELRRAKGSRNPVTTGLPAIRAEQEAEAIIRSAWSRPGPID